MYCVICRSNYLNVQDIILIPNMTLKERNFIHKVVSIRLHPVSFFPFPVIFDSALFLSLNSFSYFFSSNQISFLPFSSSFFYLPYIPSLYPPHTSFLPTSSSPLPPSTSSYPVSSSSPYSLLPWSITTVGQADTNKNRIETHFLQPLSNESY